MELESAKEERHFQLQQLMNCKEMHALELCVCERDTHHILLSSCWCPPNMAADLTYSPTWSFQIAFCGVSSVAAVILLPPKLALALLTVVSSREAKNEERPLKWSLDHAVNLNRTFWLSQLRLHCPVTIWKVPSCSLSPRSPSLSGDRETNISKVYFPP